MDWTGYSNRGYHQAATAVPSIGYDGLADFLSLVVTAGWALHDIHLIGFDLGAHVCGFAGRERDGGIGKITGKLELLINHVKGEGVQKYNR